MPFHETAIRECRMEDLASVQEIENASFDDPYPPSLFLSFFKKFPRGFRVLTIDQLLVGYCSTVLERKNALIVSLAVRPVYRRRHLGSKLLQDAIDLSKTQFNVSGIELQVSVDNNAAISLYSGFGFLVGSKIRNYYGEGRDGFSMRLQLSGD